MPLVNLPEVPQAGRALDSNVTDATGKRGRRLA
jgi:hypothetical protein